MAIKNFVIHEVRREKDGGEVIVNFKQELDDPNILTTLLTERLISLFSNASLNVGGFGIDDDFSVEPAYEQYLNKYLTMQNEEAFLELSTNMGKKFEGVLKEKTKSTVKGGFLIFYEYEYRSDNWIAIAILQRVEGLNIDNALKAIASTTFDLEKLHLGATVNISRWSKKDNERYIRFKRGTAGDLREYFENYIGCTRDKSALATETKALKNTIEKYAKDKLLVEPDHIQEYLDLAHTYISSRLRANEAVLLSELSKATFSSDPDGFVKYVNEGNFLGEELSISRVELRKFEKISHKWKGINLSFDRRSLGSTVNYENGKIIISDVPDVLANELEEENASRKKDISSDD